MVEQMIVRHKIKQYITYINLTPTTANYIGHHITI